MGWSAGLCSLVIPSEARNRLAHESDASRDSLAQSKNSLLTHQDCIRTYRPLDAARLRGESLIKRCIDGRPAEARTLSLLPLTG